MPVSTQDYLDQDPPIRGQKYVCLSFVSPENVLRNREIFDLTKFVRSLGTDIKDLIEKLEERYEKDESNSTSFRLLRERYDYLWSEDGLQCEFDFYRANHGTKLLEAFQAEHGFQTCVRGIKVRGVYEDLTEAQNRALAIKKFDDKFNVYVAELGCWCPWSPDVDDINDVVYAETQLNTLMKRYRENVSLADDLYAARKTTLLSELSEAKKKNDSLVVTPHPSSSSSVVPEQIASGSGSVDLHVAEITPFEVDVVVDKDHDDVGDDVVLVEKEEAKDQAAVSDAPVMSSHVEDMSTTTTETTSDLVASTTTPSTTEVKPKKRKAAVKKASRDNNNASVDM